MIFSRILHVNKSALLLFLLLGACSRYEVTLNSQVLYTPPPLFSDYHIPDEALRACVVYAIENQKIYDANSLETLLCPAGNIESLSGLEKFQGLKKIGLSQNKVNSIETLNALLNLEQADLGFNQIREIGDLDKLNKLNYLNLEGNPLKSCETLQSSSSILLPESC